VPVTSRLDALPPLNTGGNWILDFNPDQPSQVSWLAQPDEANGFSQFISCRRECGPIVGCGRVGRPPVSGPTSRLVPEDPDSTVTPGKRGSCRGSRHQCSGANQVGDLEGVRKIEPWEFHTAQWLFACTATGAKYAFNR